VEEETVEMEEAWRAAREWELGGVGRTEVEEAIRAGIPRKGPPAAVALSPGAKGPTGLCG